MISSPAIVGCGTVGSVLAYRLVQENLISSLKIYDFDCIGSSKSYPYKANEYGILKTKMVKLICNKLNPYISVTAYTEKITTQCIQSPFIIDCRDQKDSIIGADVKISIDGYRLYIDSRKETIKKLKYYHRYMFPRIPELVENAVNIVVEYLKNDSYIFKDIRLFDLKNSTQLST